MIWQLNGFHRLFVGCLSAVWLAACLGCGGGTTPPTVEEPSPSTIAGKVTVAGKPFKGEGYALVLVAESGQSVLLTLGADGSFNGPCPTGSLKAGVLPESLAAGAHGDASKLSGPLTITANVGENKDVEVDLPTAPPAIPRSAPSGGGGGGHSG